MLSRTASSLSTGIILILITAFTFASMDTLGKQLMVGMTVLQVVWGRYFVHAFVTTSYLIATTGTSFLYTKRPIIQIARGLAQLCASTLVYLALSKVPISDVTALIFCSPIVVTVLSVIVLKEKIGKHRIVAVLIGFLGVYLLIQPGSNGTSIYHLLAFAAGCMSATYMLLTRAVAGPEEAPATQFHTTAIGVIILSAVLVYFNAIPALNQIPLLLVIGLLSAIAHFALVRALSYAPASLLSPYLYAQVLFASTYSVLWFGDFLRPEMLAGSGLLIVSGLYIWWRERLGKTVP